MMHVMNERRWYAAAVLAAGLLAMASGTAVPSTVSSIRHSVNNNNTRVVIDVSAHPTYTVHPVKNPERIAINLPNMKLSSQLKAFNIPDGSVYRVRLNRLSWGSQIVLDLRGPVDWRDFHLSPVDGMPNRIVMDVTRTGPTTSVASVRSSSSGGRSYLVAIDAGHGGHDPGAIGKGRVYEKNEAIDIAKRVAREVNAMPGFKAFLTRDRDVFLTLSHRTQIAKDKNADIFVSIHLNTAPRRSARGSEVYFLSPAGAEATTSKFLRDKNRAARELGVEGASSADILYMLVDVNQQAMLQRSSLLAEEILKVLDRKGLPPTRSIKQRSFAVLKSIAMPSVIVETGFLTNTSDAAILTSSKGKDEIAVAIARGISSFFEKSPPPRDQDRPIVVHRVRKGDTLWKISRKYNTTVASIQKSNRLGSSKTIRVGQELVIREGHETY